jgi:plasmid maintenance system antidote protein VapI
MANKESDGIKKELEDVKALLIVFLQNLKVDNQKIADAIGMSPGRISQLINKNKYPRK